MMRCSSATRWTSGESGGVYIAAWTGSQYTFHLATGMPSMASVITAGTMLTRSSMKSILPVSIFSSRHARITSSMSGTHFSTAAGDKYGLSTARNSRCSGSSISRIPPRTPDALTAVGIMMPLYPRRTPLMS